MAQTISSEHGDIYSQLMAISQETFEKGFYETAYHALSAAMHYANSNGDEDGLLAVQEAARTQLTWIDAYADKHKMSTESTTERGGVNLYNSLITQIKAHLLVVKNQHRHERIRLGEEK